MSPFSTFSSSGDSASITYGSPSGEVEIGAAETEGTSSSVPRADHVHADPAAPSGEGATDSAPGDAESDGTATTSARSDHVHGRESWGTAADIAAATPGQATAAGSTGAVADAGHVHETSDWGVAGDIAAATPGQATAAGSTGAVADAGHVHETSDWGTAADIAALSFGDAAAAGSTGALADAGHVHEMPADPIPTPAAAGDVLTATGTAAGDYGWAAPQTGTSLPDPGASGEVLTSTGTAAGDWGWAAPAPSGLLAHTSYDPSTQAVYTPSSTALTAIDTTNLAVTFTAPSSGAVLVVLEAVVTGESQTMYLGVTDSAGQVGHHGAVSYDSSSTNSLQMRQTFSTLVAALTPGDSYTYYFAAETNGGNIYAGGGSITSGGKGPASISVWEAP